jgi:peptidylprolyl isomerase
VPIGAGQLVYVEYTGMLKDTGEVIDTTIEEEARKRGIYNPATRYGPRLVATARDWVVKGLDEAIQGAEVGQEVQVEVAPEKAFGPRDPSKIKLVPLRKLSSAGDISVGTEVEVDGRVAVVRAVGSGRVQLDFNHKYAGKTLIYNFKVVKLLEEDVEKIKALFKHYTKLEDEPETTIQDGSVVIVLPESAYMLSGLQYIKRVLVNEVSAFVKGVKEVRFIEVYKITTPQQTVQAQRPAPQSS